MINTQNYTAPAMRSVDPGSTSAPTYRRPDNGARGGADIGGERNTCTTSAAAVLKRGTYRFLEVFKRGQKRADRMQAATEIQAAWRDGRVRHKLELRAQWADRMQAATKIQATWRGMDVRHQRALTEQCVDNTPYQSKARYLLATGAYAPVTLKDRPIGSLKRKAEWGVYESTGKIDPGQPALLHSFQRREDFYRAVLLLKTPTDPDIGNIYSPVVHDMKTNSAWLLGLAHNKIPAYLTTALDDATLVRKSAAAGPPEQRNTEHNSSAYVREVMGMVQNRHFYVRSGSTGAQVLFPAAEAGAATLKNMETPSGMPKDKIKALLASRGINVSAIT